jgi:hypothetical protein
MPTISIYLPDKKYLALIKLSEKEGVPPARKASALLTKAIGE